MSKHVWLLSSLLLSSTAIAANATTLQFPQEKVAGIQDAQHIAEQYIEKHATELGLLDEMQIRLSDKRSSLRGEHFTYQQMLDGLPINGQELVVSVDKSGTVFKVYNRLNTVPAKPSTFKNEALLSHDLALDLAWAHLRISGELQGMPVAKLQYKEIAGALRLVYLVNIEVTKPLGSWQVAVSAKDGEILQVHNQLAVTKRALDNQAYLEYDGETLSRQAAMKAFVNQSRKQIQSSVGEKYVAGGAYVFDPNPKVALASDNLNDNSNASDFEPAYVYRDLPEITYKNGAYELIGPWVRIIDFDSPRTKPSKSQDGIWNAKRGNNAFNDAVSFYHIDQSQRYIQSLGFKGDKGIQEVSIEVDTDGAYGQDNSYFMPGSNRISYGHGGVDDSEDAEVILHEYGHAIQHSINSRWSGGDTGAMGEGFGDYWAASYRYLHPNGKDFHENWVFIWDGHNQYWNGRVVDAFSLKYDHSKYYYAHSSLGNGYSTDELWSTPLYQAFKTLHQKGIDKSEVDTIILEAHFGLGSGIKMREMAQSIVDTAEALYPEGPHAKVFRDKFVAQKILT